MAVDIDLSELRESPKFTEQQPLFSFVEVTVGDTVVSDFTDNVSDSVMDFSFRRTAKQNTVGNPGDSFTLTLYDDTALEIESVIYNIILDTVGFDENGNPIDPNAGGTIPTTDGNTDGGTVSIPENSGGSSSNNENSSTTPTNDAVGRFFSESIEDGVFGAKKKKKDKNKSKDKDKKDDTSGGNSGTGTGSGGTSDSETSNDDPYAPKAGDAGGNTSNIKINYGWVNSKGEIMVSNTVDGYFTRYSLEFEGASTILSIEGTSTGTIELNSPSSAVYREYPASKWNGVASDIVKDVIDKTDGVKYTKDSIEETKQIKDEKGNPKSFIMEGETPEQFIKNKLCEEATSKKSGKVGYVFYTKKGIAYFKPSDSVAGTQVTSTSSVNTSSKGSRKPDTSEDSNYSNNSEVENDIIFDYDLFRDVLTNEDDFDGWDQNNDGLDNGQKMFSDDDSDSDWDEAAAYAALMGIDYTSPKEEYDPEEEDSWEYYGDDSPGSVLKGSINRYNSNNLLNLKDYKDSNGKVNHRKAVIDAAKLVYKYVKKCNFTNKNVRNWSDMRKLNRGNANSCVYISMQEAGILRKDEMIGFHGWDRIYGKNSIKSAVRRHTIEDYFETPYNKYPYTELPKKYREAGCIYIFRHSAGINMGNGYIYICNGSRVYTKVKGRDLDYKSHFGIQMAIRPSDGGKVIVDYIPYNDILEEYDDIEEQLNRLRANKSSSRRLGATTSLKGKVGLALFFACMEKAADQYKAHGTTYGNPCASSAGRIGKTTNCCIYVSQGLYNYVKAIGKPKMFPKGSAFYLNDKFHDCDEFEKHKDFYKMIKLDKSIKKAAKDGSMLPGDICGFTPHHTTVYKGLNKKGECIFYSYGRGNKWNKVKKGQKIYSGSKHVRTIIRIKDIAGQTVSNDITGGTTETTGASAESYSLPTEIKITGYYEFYSGQQNSQVISFSPEWDNVTAIGGEWLVDDASTVDDLRNEIIQLGVGANQYTGQPVMQEGQSRILGKSSSSLESLSLKATSMWEKNYARQNTANMEVMGDPKIETGTWIYIDVYTKYGILHHTSGIYYVEEAEDSISDGSFTTSLQLRKNGNYGQYMESLGGEEDTGGSTESTTPGSTQITGSGPERIAASARLLAWPTNTKKANYPSGRPTKEFKKAINKVYPNRGWSKQCHAGASCDVFVGTVVRYSGVDKKYPRGLSEQWPHLRKSKKFYRVAKKKVQSGDVCICNGHTWIACDGKNKNAHHTGKTYGKTENNLKHWMNMGSTAVYRAK